MSKPKPAFTTVYRQVTDCAITADVYLPVRRIAHNEQYGFKRPVAFHFHGGAFMLGHSGMNSPLLIGECLSRGWTVVAPDFRLAPNVSIADQVEDVRQCVRWTLQSLSSVIRERRSELEAQDIDTSLIPDASRIISMGASSGGCLALSLAFNNNDGTPQPAAIIDFYGAKHFKHSWWHTPNPDAKLPGPPMADMPDLPQQKLLRMVMSESPVPTRGGVSLEGQAPAATNDDDSTQTNGKSATLSALDARMMYALRSVRAGAPIDAVMPKERQSEIDPMARAEDAQSWPATWILHGTSDALVPFEISEAFDKVIRSKSVRGRLVPVPGAQHTFLGQMSESSDTWEIVRNVVDEVDQSLR